MSSSPADPASRSQASLSSSKSQSHSMTQHDPTLETLVSHLLASKRSLSSISTVWRANEIATSARAALEESVVLDARTGFLRSGISAQSKILRRVRVGIEGVYKEGQRDFKNVIRTLDAANARLESTMDVLRATIVESSFRPEKEEPRSLLDFVEEKDVETMRDALKMSIRESREAQTEFDTSILAFDDDLRSLRSAMKASPSPSQSQDEDSSPIPMHLQSLETHAQEMAGLLNSLTDHFDMCITAIRHTEGGYAAVKKAASSQPPGSDPVSVSGVMNTENEIGEPISEEERQEMMEILEKDAAQVEDVVMDLREILNEMEATHEAILEHVAVLTTTYNETTAAYKLLEEVGSRLSSYLMSSQDFRLHWEETKLNIQEQLTELESMRVFYENYSASYDDLILEVSRRKTAQDKIKQIARKAMEQIENVYEADIREREEFRSDSGEFLPADLWPGVHVTPPKWEFGLADEKDGKVPELGGSVVEAAGKRNRERDRTER